LFNHVRVRVIVWKDPFASYQNGGYQVAQSLFAIGTGSWFGTGLFQGKADAIPVAETDFIFSAICEEMGLIFALCIILIFLSCYVMFLNIAMQLHNRFYKLVALGLGTCFIFQSFLTIGGVTKFIPSTGVTLPLVSYGGSSVLSTLIMFAIIQGLYILREDEDEEFEKRRQEAIQRIREREEIGRTRQI
jgi:cell division protein FtsW (lipid II flippase)